jgi:hypothetical protein
MSSAGNPPAASITGQAGYAPTPAGYELIRPIGSGASSVVWEAVRQSTGMPVALKLLEADVSDEHARRRFDRERDVMAALATHPGIVTIHDAGVEAGRPWIAMELCRRGSLAQHVAATGPLDQSTAVAVLVRLAAALWEAHGRGVVHCDVKPANVMITDGGEPALGDFGIARVSVGRATTTTVGGFSLDHVAPELLDDGRTSERSDVYSLGTTIWELAAGGPPFRADGDVSVAAVIKRIMTKPLPALPPGYEALDALLRDMTAKEPDDRLPSMAAVVERAWALAPGREGAPFPVMPPALPGAAPAGAPVTGGQTILRARPAGPRPAEIDLSTQPVAPRRLSPRLVAASVATALVLGGGTLYYVTLNRSAPLPSVSTVADPAPASATELAPATTVSATQVAIGPVSVERPGVVRGRSGGQPQAAGGAPPMPVEPGPIGPLPPDAPPLVLTTAKLPSGAVNAAYSATLAATGGTAPYRWSITSGGLPAGLTLSGSGSVTGTPTAPTPRTFSVTVTDKAGVSATKRLTISPTPMVGDINRDGPVDCVDKNILLSQWNQAGSNLSGDLDDSGKVDLTDLSMLLSHWTGSGDGSAC